MKFCKPAQLLSGHQPAAALSRASHFDCARAGKRESPGIVLWWEKTPQSKQNPVYDTCTLRQVDHEKTNGARGSCFG